MLCFSKGRVTHNPIYSKPKRNKLHQVWCRILISGPFDRDLLTVYLCICPGLCHVPLQGPRPGPIIYLSGILIILNWRYFGNMYEDTQTLLFSWKQKINLPYERYSLCTKNYEDIPTTGNRDFNAKKAVETNLAPFLLIYYLNPNSTKNFLLKLPNIYFFTLSISHRFIASLSKLYKNCLPCSFISVSFFGLRVHKIKWWFFSC